MKTISSRILVSLIVVILCLSTLTILNVKAQARTITVPDDYPTIQEAIDASTDGDTIFIKEGNYDGPQKQTLVIDNSISLIGEKAETTIITLHPNYEMEGFVAKPTIYFYDTGLAIKANDIKINDLTIQSQTVQETPMILTSGGHIETTGNNIQITNNKLELSLVITDGSNYLISDNTINLLHLDCAFSSINRNMILKGLIRLDYDAKGNEISENIVENNRSNLPSGIAVRGYENRVYNNTITNCYSGLFMYGYLGGSEYSSNNMFYLNKVYNNTIGIFGKSVGSNNFFFGNSIENNDFGVAVLEKYPIGDFEFYNNNIIDNNVQVNIDSTILSATGDEVLAYHSGVFDNGTFGNYWSDYVGVDSDGDGIGDSPYIIDDNRTDNYPLMTPITTIVDPTTTPNPSIEPAPTPEPFPTTLVIGVVAVIAVVGLVLFVYFKKFKN